MGIALEAAIGCQQDFASPDRAIDAVARPIEGNPDNRKVGRQLVLCHAGCDVGVVMLDAKGWQMILFCTGEGVAGCHVIGVQVIGDVFRLNPKQCLEMADPILKRLQCLVIFQIADMVAEKRIAIAAKDKKCSSAPRRQPEWGAGPRELTEAPAHSRERRKNIKILSWGRLAAMERLAVILLPAILLLSISRDGPFGMLRTTESSQRVRIGRSCIKKPSTRGCSLTRASALSVAMGSSLIFPLVMTRGGIGSPPISWKIR